MNINEDYYVIVNDFSKPDNLIYMMGGYASNYSHLLQTEAITQPIRYDIHDTYWQKGRVPPDIILDSDGLIIHDKLKTDFFDPLDPENIMTHLTYFVSPDEEYFEGYWLLSTPDKPKEWLDSDKSILNYRNSNNSIRGVESYYLNEVILKEIPFEKRQLFSWDAITFGETHQIIHRSFVDYLKKFENRNVKFIPLLKFEDTMAMEGPLPDFAI